VKGFRSLLGALPRNTIGVYSFSKYFGCTGWRLGVIAVHEDNILDKMIAKLPEETLKALDRRYATLTLKPRSLKFIDRIVVSNSGSASMSARISSNGSRRTSIRSTSSSGWPRTTASSC
jgi:histidinol-phosphate/aromatic aminotransferase/cobyric acid decarboxylase-like protein